LNTALCALAGYLAGSIPTGYWLVRAFRHEDIRKTGSGNIGATNVWRIYGARLGLPVMFLDTAKGFVPALPRHDLRRSPGRRPCRRGGDARPLAAAVPALRTRGKAVATCGGAFLGVAPVVGGLGAAVWILVFAVFRYASVASITAALSLPLIAVGLGEPWPVIAFAGIAALAVLVLHRPNISRLRAGTETRFRFRRPAQPVKS
jgi:glycerol-3-phosphate acyltransferase PlsY